MVNVTLTKHNIVQTVKYKSIRFCSILNRAISAVVLKELRQWPKLEEPGLKGKIEERTANDEKEENNKGDISKEKEERTKQE